MIFKIIIKSIIGYKTLSSRKMAIVAILLPKYLNRSAIRVSKQ
jgi:hypothetical protein